MMFLYSSLATVILHYDLCVPAEELCIGKVMVLYVL